MKYHEGYNPFFVLIDNCEELVRPKLEKRLNNINEEALTIVHENFRSKGIGEALVNKSKEYLDLRILISWNFKYPQKNLAGKNFWERMGFETEIIHIISVLE